jgi:acyl carrier protein
MPQSETTTAEDQLTLDGIALRKRLDTAGPQQRDDILRNTVRTQAAAILDHTTIDDDSNFVEQGLTSLKALELTRNLMTLTNVEIPLVAVIEYPTPTQLARYIADALTDTGTGR